MISQLFEASWSVNALAATILAVTILLVGAWRSRPFLAAWVCSMAAVCEIAFILNSHWPRTYWSVLPFLQVENVILFVLAASEVFEALVLEAPQFGSLRRSFQGALGLSFIAVAVSSASQPHLMFTKTQVMSRYALAVLGLILAASLALMLFRGRTQNRELFVHSTALIAMLLVGVAYSLALNFTAMTPGIIPTAYCVLCTGVYGVWAIGTVAISRPSLRTA